MFGLGMLWTHLSWVALKKSKQIIQTAYQWPQLILIKAGLSSLGVPWHTQILADQLTQFQARSGLCPPHYSLPPLSDFQNFLRPWDRSRSNFEPTLLPTCCARLSKKPLVYGIPYVLGAMLDLFIKTSWYCRTMPAGCKSRFHKNNPPLLLEIISVVRQITVHFSQFFALI